MDSVTNVELGSNFTVNNITLETHHTCTISPKYEVKCWGGADKKQILTGAKGVHAGDQANEMGDHLKKMVIFKN